MTAIKEGNKNYDSHINSTQLELSSLVGREIMLFSEQFVGQKLTSRVIMVNGMHLSLDRGTSSHLIDELINNQKLIVQFRYKDEDISVEGTLYRTPNKKCTIIIDDKIVPLTRRKYRRFFMQSEAKLAVVSPSVTDAKFLSKLQWRDSYTVNVSCGGTLISISSILMKNTLVFLNLPLQDFSLPDLVIAEVKHSFQGENNRFNVGMEFIIKENKSRYFNTQAVKILPEAVLKYDRSLRSEMNDKLVSWMKNR